MGKNVEPNSLSRIRFPAARWLCVTLFMRREIAGACGTVNIRSPSVPITFTPIRR